MIDKPSIATKEIGKMEKEKEKECRATMPTAQCTTKDRG